ncbi:MAG: tripartite tricarboxylate transporter TctB family protein [Candidatus Fimisoma sp.]|nr:tripartite tricarboxylate transporter TctB family protein [Candidatus Fimisoma sp.]
MMNMAKWKKDVLYGVGLILAAAFLFWETSDLPTGGMQYLVARSDVYVWLLLGLLVILAVSIIISAVIKRDPTPTPVVWNKLGILTVVAVLVYLLIMEKIGFILSTFIVMVFLTCLYSNRLKKFDLPTKKAKIIQVIKYVVFSIIATMAVYYIFSEALDVKLPSFDLF